MPDPTPDATRGRVLLLEPNAALRAAILTILCAERYQVETVDCLEQAVSLSGPTERTIALVAWQSMDGLLAEDRRDQLMDLTRRLRLAVMVPRRWARLLEATDLPSAVSTLIAKPFAADELIQKLEHALEPRPKSLRTAWKLPAAVLAPSVQQSALKS